MDKNAYRRAFDSVFAPDEAAERVLGKIRPGRRMNVRKIALILCAVLILSCGAAVASGRAGDWLESIIALNGQSLPEGNFQKIGQTVEDNGLRLTLDSVASDGVHTYFLLDIEALDGQDLSNTDPENVPMEDSLYIGYTLGLHNSGGYGFRTIRIDDGSDPSRARLALKFDFGKAQNGSWMTLTINELYKGVWETNGGKRLFEHKTIRKGEWKFFFRLSRRLDGIHYEIEGYKIDICISPLGMAIDGAGSGRFGKKISLLMQDGTRIEGTGYSYSKGMKDYKLSYEQASW